VRGLDFHVVRTSLYVVSDYDLVRSMLQNLIGNALRYTERGKVIVGCRRTDGRVRVCVWDTGPGIPEESQQLIFGAFTRLPGSGGSEHGVGLGLAIVQRVAELLGARVELKSQLSRGSMFAVSIERGASQPVALPAAPDIAPSAAGLRVLCVDNEPAILRGLSAVLKRMGAEVQVARNAQEAANMDGVFDLALVDYHLDEGDGLALRAPLKHRVRRFVVVTADTSIDVEAAITASGAELVRKPIKPQTLKGLLNRA
jgi:CheY-like chemotaxis protein